jgi:hypothetical protein
MRYSSDQAVKPTELLSTTSSNRAFFEAAGQAHGAGSLRGALLLIGGNDWRSLALRRAQAPLRFDRRSSLWSHVALIAQWDADNVGDSVGLEVSLDPQSEAEQGPERNGVTSFKLSRYFDTARYPNVALVAVDLGRAAESQRRKDALLTAACNPCRDRERYPLWNALSSWARYAYAPELLPSPLTDGIAMPCAAFCEYAFESAGVDLTPGATGNNACPEVLWATINLWQAVMKAQVTFSASMLFRDSNAAAPDALPMTIELPNPVGTKKRRPAKKRSARAAVPVRGALSSRKALRRAKST